LIIKPLDERDLHPDETRVLAGSWCLIDGPEIEGDKVLGGSGFEREETEEAMEVRRENVKADLEIEHPAPTGVAVFPLLSFFVWNVNGLSLGASGDTGKGRRRREAIDRGMNFGASEHAVIAINEANVSEEHLPLIHRRWGSTHHCFVNAGVSGRQGVIILVSKKATTEFDVSCERIENEPCAKGHILFAITRHRTSKEVVVYVNLYLKSGDKKMRIQQILLARQKLAEIRNQYEGDSFYVVGGGDLNMTPDSEDEDNRVFQHWLNDIAATELRLQHVSVNDAEDGEESNRKHSRSQREGDMEDASGDI